MRSPHRQRGQVLILLAAWLFFGGGGSTALVAYDRPASQIKKAVKSVIADPGRRNSILTDIDRWESVQEMQNEYVSANRKELLKTLRRKEAQRTDVEPIMAALDKTFFGMDWDFINFRFHVKDQVTNAEWAEIVAQPNP
jgi:PHD/YefM family antitoxin component YafN of YafNO toxin-antitoxin module